MITSRTLLASTLPAISTGSPGLVGVAAAANTAPSTAATVAPSAVRRLFSRVVVIVLLAAPVVARLEAALIEFGPKNVRINPMEILKGLGGKSEPARESAGGPAAADADDDEDSDDEAASAVGGSAPVTSAGSGISEVQGGKGPVRSEPPYLFAFMPDGRWRAGAGAGDADFPNSFTKAVWDNQLQARLIAGSQPNCNPIARVMATRYRTGTFLNSQPAVRLVRMAYGLTPVNVDSLVLLADPGIFVEGRRTVPNEFEQRRLLASRRPFHAQALEAARAIRLVRFFATYRIAGAYDFGRGGYSVIRMDGDPVVPFAGAGEWVAPSFFPIPEAEAEAMARPSEGAVFVYEFEGDLESPEFQREHAAVSQGLLCARVSKLTVHLLPSAHSSVPSRWSQSRILLETNVVAASAESVAVAAVSGTSTAVGTASEGPAAPEVTTPPIKATPESATAEAVSAAPESLERHLRSVIARIVEKRGQVTSGFFVGPLTMERPQEWIAAHFKPGYAATGGAAALTDYPVPPRPMISGRFMTCFSALKDFAAYRSNELTFHRLSSGEDAGAERLTAEDCGRLVAGLKEVQTECGDGRKVVQGFHYLVGEMVRPTPVYLVTGTVPAAGKSYFLGIYAQAPEGWRLMPYLPWGGLAKQKKDSAEGRMW